MPDFDALAHDHRAAIWRYLCVLGCDASLADDLTQEVFLVVLRRPEFRAEDPRAVLTFLRHTARNLYLRSRRGRTTRREVEAGDLVWEQHCGDGDGEERLRALRACIARLPERSQHLLQATYGDGLSRRAVAHRLGLGEDGIKSALRRLRTLLQQCIERRLRRQT